MSSGTTTLSFGVAQYGVTAFVANPNWQMTPNNKGDTAIHIDGKFAGSYATLVSDKTTVEIAIPTSMVPKLQDGDLVRMDFELASYSFPLNHSRRGLAALFECFRGKTVTGALPEALPPPKPSNPAPSSTLGGPGDAESVFGVAAAAVFTVYSASSNQLREVNSISQGTAVAVAPTRLFTNCHVALSDSLIFLRFGDKQPLNTRVAHRNPSADMCVLETDVALPTYVKVRPYDDVRIGERVYAIGSPKELDRTISEGLVSAKRADEHVRYIQTSAPISHGSSGGGLLR